MAVGFSKLHSLKPVFVCSECLLFSIHLCALEGGPIWALSVGFLALLFSVGFWQRGAKEGFKGKKNIELVISTPRFTPARLL